MALEVCVNTLFFFFFFFLEIEILWNLQGEVEIKLWKTVGSIGVEGERSIEAGRYLVVDGGVKR